MKTISISFLLIAVALCGGCLSKPSLVKESFSFTAPPVNATQNTNGPVLAVNRIFVAPPFDRQQFTYRTGDVSFENDPYAGFLVPPGESLSEPVRALLRSSGVFRDVIERASPLQPDLEAAISITQLYGDFRESTNPAAILNLRLLLYEANRGGPGHVLLQTNYDERVSIKARTAAAVMAGWNQGLQNALATAANDIAAALKNR